MYLQKFESILKSFGFQQETIELILEIISQPVFKEKIKEFNDQFDYYISLFGEMYASYENFKEFSSLIDSIYSELSSTDILSIPQTRGFKIVGIIDGIQKVIASG